MRHVLMVCLLAVVLALAGAGAGSARSAADGGGRMAALRPVGRAPLALAKAPVRDRTGREQRRRR